ncbi:MAG: hypothetical protein WBI07_13480 [Mobilitalea sp.]
MDQNKTIGELIRELLKTHKVSIAIVSEALECTQQSLRNKLTRDSFSIKDLLIISGLCGFTLGLINDSDIDVEPILLNISDYLTLQEMAFYNKAQDSQIQDNVNKLKELLPSLPEGKIKDSIKDFLNENNNL